MRGPLPVFLLPSLIACVHAAAPAPASEAVGAAESAKRAACHGGDNDACLSLVAELEGERPTPAHVREAVDLMATRAENDVLSAQVATLVTTAHPEAASGDVRERAWRALCSTFQFSAACEVGGWELADRPAAAAALWREGCAAGLQHLCAPASPAKPVDVDLPPAFRDGLARVGGEFHMPAGFHAVASPPNPHFETEFAILSDDGRLEVRFATRDNRAVLASLDACKGSPDCVGADFLQVERAQAYVTMANVTQRPPTELAVAQFPPLAVRMEFNAHWGATSGGQADAAFSPDRPPVILVFLHRDPGADLYVFFVLHDPSAMNDLQVAAFHALRFAEPVGLGGTWLPD